MSSLRFRRSKKRRFKFMLCMTEWNIFLQVCTSWICQELLMHSTLLIWCKVLIMLMYVIFASWTISHDNWFDNKFLLNWFFINIIRSTWFHNIHYVIKGQLTRIINSHIINDSFYNFRSLKNKLDNTLMFSLSFEY